MNLLAAVTLLEAAVSAAEQIAESIRRATSEEPPTSDELAEAKTRTDDALNRLRAIAALADDPAGPTGPTGVA
jgi:hypothetical protein